MISVWNIIEIPSHLKAEDELNLSMGGKFKMVLNFSDNLMDYPNVIDIYSMGDLISGIEIEFDPAEP